jgi:hypothetical protein
MLVHFYNSDITTYRLLSIARVHVIFFVTCLHETKTVNWTLLTDLILSNASENPFRSEVKTHSLSKPTLDVVN